MAMYTRTHAGTRASVYTHFTIAVDIRQPTCISMRKSVLLKSVTAVVYAAVTVIASRDSFAGTTLLLFYCNVNLPNCGSLSRMKQ